MFNKIKNEMKKQLHLLSTILGLIFIMGACSTEDASKLALKTIVKAQNQQCPIKIGDIMTCDSIVCHDDQQDVTIYYTVPAQYNGIDFIENIKQQDDQILKSNMTVEIQKDTTMKAMYDLMESLNYKYNIMIIADNGEIIKSLSMTKEEYAHEIVITPQSYYPQIKNSIDATNTQCPINIDQNTILEKCEFDESNAIVNYYYSIHDIEVSADQIETLIKPNVLASAKSNPAMQIFTKANVSIKYIYNDSNDNLISEFIITPEEIK